MRRKLNFYRPGFALLFAAVLMVSCRPRSSSIGCNLQDWQKPSIVVGADHVDVVLFDDSARLPIDKLHDYLSELPNRYWQHGRIIRVGEGGLRAPNTDNLIRRNMQQAKQIVESLGIKICPNPLVGAASPPNKSLDASRGSVFRMKLL
jgi:hypothetical protein